jgi:hypothetical protein
MVSIVKVKFEWLIEKVCLFGSLVLAVVDEEFVRGRSMGYLSSNSWPWLSCDTLRHGRLDPSVTIAVRAWLLWRSVPGV